jgi:hypothetical protein
MSRASDEGPLRLTVLLSSREIGEPAPREPAVPRLPQCSDRLPLLVSSSAGPSMLTRMAALRLPDSLLPRLSCAAEEIFTEPLCLCGPFENHLKFGEIGSRPYLQSAEYGDDI